MPFVLLSSVWLLQVVRILDISSSSLCFSRKVDTCRPSSELRCLPISLLPTYVIPLFFLFSFFLSTWFYFTRTNCRSIHISICRWIHFKFSSSCSFTFCAKFGH